MQLLDGVTADSAVFAQKFDPQLQLIGFLQSSVDLGTKLGIRSRACASRVCAATNVPERNN
jgi:hypothetical protein